MSDITYIIGSSLRIPEHSALHIIHLLMQTVLGRQLMTARIDWISKLGSPFGVGTVGANRSLVDLSPADLVGGAGVTWQQDVTSPEWRAAVTAPAYPVLSRGGSVA